MVNNLMFNTGGSWKWIKNGSWRTIGLYNMKTGAESAKLLSLSLPTCFSCSLFIYRLSVCFNLVVGSLLSPLDLCNTPTINCYNIWRGTNNVRIDHRYDIVKACLQWWTRENRHTRHVPDTCCLLHLHDQGRLRGKEQQAEPRSAHSARRYLMPFALAWSGIMCSA